MYRSAEEDVDPRALIDDLSEALAGIRANPQLTESWTTLLLLAGELEASVADAQSQTVDEPRSPDWLLRALSVRAAEGYLAATLERAVPRELPHAIEGALARAHERDLPRRVTRRVPEGYAYYALYPETYATAAEDFLRACSPQRVTVIGIRSIGTSLSAVVHATLVACGCAASSFTVRPRGHPFDRVVELGQELRRRVRDARDGWFAVVDEGPGISGSSFAATADALAALDVPDERIVFFPSWVSDGAALRNVHARERWRRHAKFMSSFEDLWLTSGRLLKMWNAASFRDWSAGCWRDDPGLQGASRPAVQPQHEQRKYRVATRDGELLLKFVGLGRYGVPRLRVATHLAQLGFTPGVVGLHDGFLATRFVDGIRLDPAALDRHDLEQIGAYIAVRPPAEKVSTLTQLRSLEHVADVNTAAALGDDAARRLAELRLTDTVRASVHAVAVDGRMQPYEWLRCGRQLVKLDAASHYDDHFQPGPQDPAWDLAGACVELDLTAASTAIVSQSYVAATGDAMIVNRLPFHRAAYLACRLGYVTLCRDSLGESEDGKRFGDLATDYRRHLERALRDVPVFIP